MMEFWVISPGTPRAYAEENHNGGGAGQAMIVPVQGTSVSTVAGLSRQQACSDIENVTHQNVQLSPEVTSD